MADYAAADNFFYGSLPLGYEGSPRTTLSVLGAVWMINVASGSVVPTYSNVNSTMVSNGNGTSNTIMLAHKGLITAMYVGSNTEFNYYDAGYYQRGGLYSFDHNREPSSQWFVDSQLGTNNVAGYSWPYAMSSKTFITLNNFSSPHDGVMPALFADASVQKIGAISPSTITTDPDTSMMTSVWTQAWYWNSPQTCGTLPY